MNPLPATRTAARPLLSTYCLSNFFLLKKLNEFAHDLSDFIDESFPVIDSLLEVTALLLHDVFADEKEANGEGKTLSRLSNLNPILEKNVCGMDTNGVLILLLIVLGV